MKLHSLLASLLTFCLFLYVSLLGAAPQVTQLIPNFGTIGTNVEVDGTGFTAATSVNFDTQSAIFSVTNDSLITATAPVHVPGIVNVSVTTGIGTSSQTHASLYTYQASSWFAYVANLGDDNITPIDIATNTAGIPIGVGGEPVAIAITPDGKTAYVANEFDNTVTPIDIATNTAGTPIGVGTSPVAIAITPDGKTAYVANEIDNTVTPIDIATNMAGTIIGVGTNPNAIAITPDGKTAYVVNLGDNTVTPIDIATNTAGTPIGVGGGPDAIAITPDGKTAYVANANENTVTQIDIATNTAGATIVVGNGPSAIAITPDGKTAYVANEFDNTVTPIDIATNTAGTPIGVGSGPDAIAITPDGKTAYVANEFDNTVTPIDIATNTAGTTIGVGNEPSAIAITPDQAPFAAFTVIPAPAGMPSSFDASTSASPVGSIASYAWNFGDGSQVTITAPTITHTYANAGTYLVTLTVTNTAGTSTTQVFTGQTMSRNGGPLAQFQQSVVIGKQSTTLAVATSPNPATFGSPVTLTATATSAGGIPTGTVTFKTGGKTLCTATLSNGVASCTTTAIPVGTNTITANYSGNNNFSPSMGTAQETITKASTSTTVTAKPSSAPFGSTVTLTATVTSAGGIPAGTVTFTRGGKILCTAPLTNGVASCTTTAIPVGTNTITANYSGDNTFSPSMGTVQETITKASTSTTVKAKPSPAPFGSTVTLTATVTSAGGIPAGTVTFTTGGKILCTATLSNGVASCPTTAIPVGTNTITANYSGDNSFSSSMGTAQETITKASTSTTVKAKPSPAPFGSTVTLTATVTSAGEIPAGTVTFTTGGKILCTATLSNGVASCPTTAIPVGTNTITANYSGNNNFSPSMGTVQETITKASTSTTVKAKPSPAPFGSTVTLTATVTASAGTPTGTVTFTTGGKILCTATLSHGVASCPTTAIPVGTNTITANYSGDNHFSSSMGTVQETITKASTSTTVTAKPSPAPFGSTVTLTATVTSAGGIPAGTVTFTTGGKTLCTATLSNGVASCTTTAIPVGTNTITANYSGNNTFSPSNGTAQETITKASTSTTVTAKPSPAPFGSTVTLTATVTASAGTPTGTVTFTTGGKTLCTAPLTNGVASCPTTAIPVGTNTITANYSGNNNFSPSMGTVQETITKASTSTTVKAKPSPAPFGSTVTLTATVTASAGTPTGTVTFKTGGKTLCTAPLTNGVASCPTTAIPVGTNTITANYSGNNNFSPSMGTAQETITKASTSTTVTAEPSPAPFGSTVTLTAAVTASAGTPTGTVTFTTGGKILCTAPLTNGVASCTTTAIPVGTNTITANYSGDNTFSPSVGTVQETITNKASTTTTVTAKPSPFKHCVTLTARVTSAEGIPTGTVTFKVGCKVLCTASLSNGVASCKTKRISVGKQTITATYSGDNNFLPSSGTTTEKAKKGHTCTTVNAKPSSSSF